MWFRVAACADFNALTRCFCQTTRYWRTSEIDAAAALFDREVAESRLGVWKRTLHQFLEAQKNGSPNQLADGLLGELAHWSARSEGEDLDDDITMVTIRVTDTC